MLYAVAPERLGDVVGDHLGIAGLGAEKNLYRIHWIVAPSWLGT